MSHHQTPCYFVLLLVIFTCILQIVHAENTTTTASSFGSDDLKYGTVSSFTISQDSAGKYECNSLSLSQVELKIKDNTLTFSQLWTKDVESILTCNVAEGDTTGEKHTCQSVTSGKSQSVCLRIKNTISTDKKLALAVNSDSSNCATNNFDTTQPACSNPTSLTSASSLIVTFSYDGSSSGLNGSTLVGGIIAIFLFGAFVIAGGAFGYWYFIQKRREKLLGEGNIEFKKTTLEEA